jgi:two-component system sensor histidine kinase QseC
MPQPGTIRWSSERTEDGTTVLVEDTGPGIPKEELALVTNRFFRGRNKSSLGSGLGLSIVDLAVRTSGARLRLRNRDDTPGLRAEIVWDIRSAQRPSNAAETGRAYWRILLTRSRQALRLCDQQSRKMNARTFYCRSG